MSDLSSTLTAPSLARPDQSSPRLDLLAPLRHWLEGLPIDNPKLARFWYNLIPGQCPFERDIVIAGRKLGHIPPLCKLNPLYEQFVGLRFRSMCYLVDECGESL